MKVREMWYTCPNPARSEDELRIRIRRGINLLNEKKPNWRKLVNPEQIRSANSGDWILGQVLQTVDYQYVFASMRDELGITIKEADSYGFDPYPYESEVIDRLWREEIAKAQS